MARPGESRRGPAIHDESRREKARPVEHRESRLGKARPIQVRQGQAIRDMASHGEVS